MENNEELSFDNLLSGENSEWELLDDTTAVVETPEPKPEPEGEEPKPEPKPVDDTSFEEEFVEDSEGEEEEEEEREETNEEDDSELFNYIGKTLADKGILSTGEDVEFKSEDDIYNSIEETIKNGVDSWKKGLGEESLRYIDFIEKGGNAADYIELNAQSDYSNVDLESDDNKKAVISAFYKDKGFSDKKIQKLIENAEDMEELSEEATEAQSYFKEKKEGAKEKLIAQQALEAEQRENQQQTFITNIEDYIKTNDEVSDFPLKTEAQKQEIKEYMFKKNVPYKQADGSVVKISQYMADKMKKNSDEKSKLKDIVFDALYTKHGSAPIKKKTLSDRNRKLADLAKQHKNKNTSAKLSGSGGKSKKPRTNNKTHSFDDGQWEDF